MVAEQGLDPVGGAGDPLRHRRLPPERLLPAHVGDQLVRGQDQRGDPAPDGLAVGFGPAGFGPVGFGPVGGPGGELPADPFGHRERGQLTVVPPQPLLRGAVRELDRDREPYTGEALGGQALVHPVREALGGEDDLVGLRGGWIEGRAHGQIGGRRAGGDRPGFPSAGQPVRLCPVRAEPGRHVSGGQRRELAQRPDPQAQEQVGEVRAVQYPEGVGRQELGRSARRHDDAARAPGGQFGGEQPVGDAGPAVVPGLHHGVGDEDPQGLLATVETGGSTGRNGAHSGPYHLDAGSEGGDRRSHQLEQPALGVRVPIPYHQIGAVPLGVPEPLPAPYPRRARRRRAGRHPGVLDHRTRDVRVDPHRRHRPVRTPQHQRSAHGARSARAARGP